MKTQSDLLKRIPIELTDIRLVSPRVEDDASTNRNRADYPTVLHEIFNDPQSAPGNTGYGSGTGMNPDVKPYDIGTVPGGNQ